MNNYEEIKKIIEDFLKKLTVKFDEIQVLENETYSTILIKTNDSGVLIGNNGESLKALNHIIKRIIEKRHPDNQLQFLLDINEYNSKRISDLKNQAEVLAQRARMFKSNVKMDPINAYERMIIHSLFVNNNEIKTESEGDGKERRIIFKYIADNKKSSDII